MPSLCPSETGKYDGREGPLRFEPDAMAIDGAMLRCDAQKRDGYIIWSDVFEHRIVTSLRRHRFWLRTRWSFLAIIGNHLRPGLSGL